MTTENTSWMITDSISCPQYLIASSSDSDTTLKEAISDTNVPAPPEEDESDTTENNDMESEGITNEEAGLD